MLKVFDADETAIWAKFNDFNVNLLWILVQLII